MRERKRRIIHKRKIRKIAAIVVASFAIVSVGLALAAPNYIKRHINDYIWESSEGEYQIYFSDIRANLYTQTVRIDSLKLIPQQTTKAHYAISASNLKASGISVFEFFFRGNLKIKTLQIQQPEFEIHGQDGQKRDALNQQELAQKLIPFFTNRLKQISIDEIRLEQAHFDHYRLNNQTQSLSSIKDLNVGIRKFRIDSSTLRGQNELFKADDIYVRINDYNRALGDSTHHLQIAELTYSIRKNSIFGKNLVLIPNDSTNHSSTLYWINIPEIRLSAQNLRSILGNDSVNIDSVLIKNSNIRVKPGKNVKKINFRDLKKYDLYELIRNDFSFIHVNHLILHANELFFEPKQPNLDNSQFFNEVEVSALNFQLDSADDLQLNKVLYSDHISLRVKSYSLKLNDQIHLFEANNIRLSSFDSLLKAESIRLHPERKEHTLPVTVNVNCDSLVIHQVDLCRLFHFREMPLNTLAIYQPKVVVNQLVNKKAGIDTDEQSLLYQFIGDYIKGVYANLISIHSGYIEFNDLRKKWDGGHISTGFDFQLTDFSLDSVSARQTDKLFFATNLELNFKNYQMKLADQLHKLSVKNVEVSSLKEIAIINQLRLSPDRSKNVERALKRLNRSELYDIQIPRLSLQNTDIHHAFFQKGLNINQFNIVQPKIYLEVFAHERKLEKKLNIDEFYELLSDYITAINIEDLTVDEGDFQLLNHSRKGKTTNLTNRFSLSLERFRLNENELRSKRILYSDNFILRTKDHLFKLSDNVHYLKASEISFTSRNSTGIIKNALLYPEISSEAYKNLPWHFQISAPRIRLKEVDLENAVFSETLNVGAVEIESPVIQFYRNAKTKEQDKLNFKDINLPLPEEIKELNLGKLQLKKGKLVIHKTIEGNNDRIAEASIEFNLAKMGLKRSEDNNAARFSAQTIETNINDLKVWPGKTPYTIDVKNVRFSSSDKLLDLQELYIRNNGRSEDQIVSISLPTLRFEQLDPTAAFDNNRFHTARLVVSDPVFNLRKIENERRKNPLYIKLSPDLNTVMDELSAGEVQVNNATLNLIGNQKTSKLDQIDISMREVQLDTTRAITPLGAKDLTIVRRNIKYTDPDKLYNILIDRFTYSTQDKNLLLNGLHITPRYGPDQFQQFIKFQQDYYSGDIQQVKFENINLNRWFEKREFTGKNIDINQLNLLIYRDKRLPFNDEKYPPMPQDLIRSIELFFYFDTVKLGNSNFIYSEQLEEIPEPGRVSFEKLNARLYPFTNLKYQQVTNPDMHMNATCLLMGVSELKAQLEFDMISPINRFEVRGSLSPFDMTAMNPILENSASISIRSGQLNRFDFEFSGDSTVASGKLRFAYDDLKITILAHKDGNTKEAKFLSFLANSLMVKSKHPRTSILLPDDIHFYRDPNKSTLNYLWKSVFSGAKNTFGVKEDQN